MSQTFLNFGFLATISLHTSLVALKQAFEHRRREGSQLDARPPPGACSAAGFCRCHTCPASRAWISSAVVSMAFW